VNASFEGWPLATALERTTGARESEGADSALWDFVESGRLIAFGRQARGSVQEWISVDRCRSLIYRNYKNSSAACTDRTIERVLDIIIYPVLHSPVAAETLDGMSLRDAFSRFVLGDPEVQLLGAKAIKIRPDLEDIYVEACASPAASVWPVEFEAGSLAGGFAPDALSRYFGGPAPAEVQRAADVLGLRYGALLKLLRRSELQALGDPVKAGVTNEILPSIWSNRAYYWDHWNGNLVQIGDAEDVEFETRWRAVMLRKPHPDQSSTTGRLERKVSGRWVEKETLTTGEKAVFLAIQELFPNGLEGVKPQDRNRYIIDFLKGPKKSKYTEETIKRCLRKISFDPI
jgi:hypothetical protein